MWMLTFLPDSILYAFVNIVFYAGVIASVLGFVFNLPFLRQYRFIVQVVGILLLVAGVYFKGGYEVEMQWRERVAELEKKVKIAEDKSNKANAQMQTKIVTKIIKIKEKAKVVKETIYRDREVINRDCKLNDAAIEAYNAGIVNKEEKK